MKIAAFNGSPRKKGNTHILIENLFEPLREAGFECEEIKVGGIAIHGCKACGFCVENPGKCIQVNDPMNEWIEKMLAADAIILASPTYFANVTSEMKALIDRAGHVSFAAGGLFKHKVGAPVVALRRGGAIQVYNAIMAFYGINEMVVPMSNYWNMGFGEAAGEVLNDEEGLATMKTLGINMAWVLNNLKK